VVVRAYYIAVFCLSAGIRIVGTGRSAARRYLATGDSGYINKFNNLNGGKSTTANSRQVKFLGVTAQQASAACIATEPAFDKSLELK
jgi:hypothetical protein